MCIYLSIVNMIFSRMHLKILINIYNNKFILKYNTTSKILKLFLTQNLRDISTFYENNVFEEQLKEVFKFKNSNVSNWIIEVSYY